MYVPQINIHVVVVVVVCVCGFNEHSLFHHKFFFKTHNELSA